MPLIKGIAVYASQNVRDAMHAYQLQGRIQFWCGLLTKHTPTALEPCLAASVATGAPTQRRSLLKHLLAETVGSVLTRDSSPAATQIYQLGQFVTRFI